MLLFWIGVLLMSLSWAYWVPFFGVSAPGTGGILSGCGFLLIVITCISRSSRSTGLDTNRPVALMPRAWGACVGCVRRCSRPLVYSAVFTFIVMIVLWAISLLYPSVHARCWRLAPISWASSPLLAALGLKNTCSDGSLFIKTPEYLLEFVPEMGKVGVFPWLLVMTSCSLAIVAFAARRRVVTLLGLWGAGLGFLVIRYIALVALYCGKTEVLKKGDLGIFIDPTITLISFLPFAFVLMALCRLDDFSLAEWRELRPRAREWKAGLATLVGVFSLVGYFGFQDPGELKKGRVLIDDSYSGEWEQAGRRFDKEWYGDLSVYNYSSLASVLAYYYDVEINRDKPLTKETIGNHDVLIIKTPTRRFSANEVEDILAWVREGGGLFVMGDHTNLMGMNAFANELIQPLGVRLKYGGVNALTGGFSLWERSATSNHPAIRNAEYFEYLTSCSIDSPPFADDVMLVNNNLSDQADYSSSSFFGDFVQGPDVDFGPLVLAAAVPYGRGRAIVFGDSTTFNTFTLFMHGHSEFLLGAIDYLNRINTPLTRWRFVLLITSVLALGTAIFWALGSSRWPFLLLVLAGAGVGYSGATTASAGLIERGYPSLVESKRMVRVNVLWSKSRYGLPPAVGSTKIPAVYAMDTFYVTIQRIGYVPSLKSSARGLVTNADIAVIINPAEHFDDAETRVVADWVARGGRLLLLENSGDWGRSHIGDFLSRFDIQIHGSPSLHVHDLKQVPLPDDKVECFVQNYGTGKVVLVFDSSRFSREQMGHSFEKPGREEMKIYKSEFALFEEILFGQEH